MASNQIPRSYDQIVELLEDAADGAQAQGAAAGLKQNDEAAIRSSLGTLIGTPPGPGNVPPATPGAKATLNTAKAAKVAATAASRAARSNGRLFAQTCVAVLKPRLGTEWTSAWQNAGFSNGSLAVPDNPMTMLQQFAAYFTANPAHEVPNISPTISATASGCAGMATAISSAETASNQSLVNLGAAKVAFDNAIAAARARLTGLREELTQLLNDEDERWYAFGFDRPADPETPEVPVNVVVTPGPVGSKTIHVDWPDARRAESYRVVVRNVSSGASLAEKIVEDSDASFSGLTAGMPVAVTVTARNAKGGESVESLRQTATVP